MSDGVNEAMSKKSSVGLSSGRPSDKRKAHAIEALTTTAETVRVNFDLNKDEHTKLKVHAARRGVSIADVLREFIAGLSE